MDDVEPVWSRLMMLAGYRAAIVCARLAAGGAVASAGALIVAGNAGASSHLFLSLMAVCAVLSVLCAAIGWSVIGLAVRQVLASLRTQGRDRFSVEWVPLLTGLYFRQLIGSRWNRRVDTSSDINEPTGNRPGDGSWGIGILRVRGRRPE